MIRNLCVRSFHGTRYMCSKKIPKNAKGHSSHQWLSRQMSDPFVEMAKMKNYRYIFKDLFPQLIKESNV